MHHQMDRRIINQRFKPEKCKKIHYNKCDNSDKQSIGLLSRQDKANCFLSDYSYYFAALVKLTTVHAVYMN